MKRRDWLVAGSGIAIGAAGTAAWSRMVRAKTAEPPMPTMPSRLQYDHGAMPPTELGPLALDRVTRPPAPSSESGPVTRSYRLDVIDQQVGISADQRFDAWTFGGSMPGPVLRATEGDRLEITLSNRTNRAHNLHFHGRHEIGADGWEPVPPGGEFTYRLTAGPFGVHPYHCDFTPSEDHVANGLYGLLIVDPRPARPPAQEFCLVFGGFDVDGDRQSDWFGWNGVTGFYAKYPIKVTTGELIRVYLANLVSDQPMASFHLHAEAFSVYRNGTRLVPDEETDIVSLAPAERAVIEFRLPARGRYMFHPHQRVMAERGGMGWFAAV